MKPANLNPGRMAIIRHKIAEIFCYLNSRLNTLLPENYIPCNIDTCDDDTAIVVKSTPYSRALLTSIANMVPNAEYTISGDHRLTLKISLP